MCDFRNNSADVAGEINVLLSSYQM
jgi:hypothetical protein